MTEAALQLTGVVAGYGETVVLEGLEFGLAQGEAASLIGRNGVGKTTLLATVIGATTQHGGEIRLNGRALTGLSIHARARLGLGFVPQEREIFPSLTVAENLSVAARPGRWNLANVLALFPPLADRLDNRGNQLSGGEQQMLSIGRALMGNPKVLLMDEPSEGLAPVIVEELQRVLEELRRDGDLTILLVEQNTRIALDFAHRCLVMDRGRIVFDGASAELQADADRLHRLIGVAGGA